MPALVTLSDVKTYLNITTTTNDAELTQYLADAVSAVGDIIGPLSPQSFTDEFDDVNPTIVLPRTPVQSLTSVSIQPWLGATPIDDSTAWRVNTTTGVMRRVLMTGTMPYYGRGSIFTVTYLAGYSDIPNPVNMAVLRQVADMWKSQRGASPLAPGQMDPADQAYPGGAGFLDQSVMELLLPYLMPPGVA